MKIHLFQKQSSHGGQWWHLGFSEATKEEASRFSDVAYSEAEHQGAGLKLMNHWMDPYPDHILEYRSGTQAQILEHAEWVAIMMVADLVLDPL